MGLEQNIKKCREALGMSQEVLAERLDISRQAVSKWETGESRPSTHNLLELSKILDVSVNDLIASEGEEGEIACTKCKRSVDWATIVYAVAMFLAVVPFSISVIFHTFLPQQIPAHYNSLGHIDRYGDKRELLVIGCILSAICLVFSLIVGAIKCEKQIKIFLLATCVVVSTAFITMQIVFSVKALWFGLPSDGGEGAKSIWLTSTMFIIINVLMVLLGVILPFTKPNMLFGFRISSTMNDSENWRKTHKLTGLTLAIGGAGGALFAALIEPIFASISIVFLIVGIAVPTIYSVKMAKKTQRS